MTNNEAIGILKDERDYLVKNYKTVLYVPRVEAFNMAIKALSEEQEPRTGHWTCDRANVRCSYCGKGYKDFYGKANIVSYSYCPNCGAKMEDTERGTHD